jgi:hypothetical protein
LASRCTLLNSMRHDKTQQHGMPARGSCWCIS